MNWKWLPCSSALPKILTRQTLSFCSALFLDTHCGLVCKNVLKMKQIFTPWYATCIKIRDALGYVWLRFLATLLITSWLLKAAWQCCWQRCKKNGCEILIVLRVVYSVYWCWENSAQFFTCFFFFSLSNFVQYPPPPSHYIAFCVISSFFHPQPVVCIYDLLLKCNNTLLSITQAQSLNHNSFT